MQWQATHTSDGRPRAPGNLSTLQREVQREDIGQQVTRSPYNAEPQRSGAILESKTYFRVLINGENFLLEFGGSPRRLGFYTTRFVEALDGAEAENIAIDLVRNDQHLRSSVLNAREDPPMLYAREVEQIDAPQKATPYSTRAVMRD